MTDGEPIPFDRLHTLENLLGMYEYRDEDICVNEAIANAVDAFRENSIKNGKIDITFDRKGDHGYITFHNNAPPMTKEQFEKKYHTVSFSIKKKGEGIGFAGVGAKLFLASNHGGEIITITGSSKTNFIASKMFRTSDDLVFKTSLKYPLRDILGTDSYVHKYGTTYRVRLSLDAYKYLKENIVTIVQFWWNYGLLTKQIEITVDGKPLEPFDPKGEKFRKIFTWKKYKINCICWITKQPIPEELRHIVYNVYGKRIHSDPLDITIRIKGDYSTRVFCVADVSFLAGYLTTNKERFEKNWQTNDCRHAIQKMFWSFLEENGLVTSSDASEASNPEIVNELTKRLDTLLNTKEFKDLNPFLNSSKRKLPLLDDSGDLVVSEEEGGGAEGGKGGSKGGSRDHGEGTSYIIDEEGKKLGSLKERKAKGLHISPTDQFPEEPEEAWVDLSKGAIVVNTEHKFWKNVSKNAALSKFNLNRILIEALIKFKNEEIEWDPKETLNKYRDLLHKTWMEE